MRHAGTALAWIAAVLLVLAAFVAGCADAQDKGASSDVVRSLEQIAKAGELAGAVAGVAAVRNDLRVANRPSRA